MKTFILYVYPLNLWGVATFYRVLILLNVLPPLWKWVYTKRYEFAIRSKFFPFSVDCFSNGTWRAGKQTTLRKQAYSTILTILPPKKGEKNSDKNSDIFRISA